MKEEIDTLPQHYQVNVVILEGRHLALTDTNTKVKISIGRKKKTIHSKTNKTDSPYYNDFCLFHYFLPLNILLDEILIIKVYQKKLAKFVGSFSVELATVWSQPNHQFYHKWAVLTNPNRPTSGIRGFLKCDIVILAKGVVVKPLEDENNQDKIEENLLVPYGGIKDRHRARIVFSIFRADSFSPSPTNIYDPNLVQPYIRITYGGSSRKTNVAKVKETPVWNEELTFQDLIPPLYQNILVEVCDRKKSAQKGSLANTNIDIGTLYANGEDGFLPTFGPSFLYLYQPFKKFERHKNYSNISHSFTYMCRLLLSIRTEVVDYAEEVRLKKKEPRKTFKPISPIKESIYFEYKKFILFAAIFDVLLFDTKYFEKNISIRLTIGPKGNTRHVTFENPKENKTKDEEAKDKLENLKNLKIFATCNTTPNHRCKVEKDYGFITFSGKFPCVHIFGEWPDSLRRIYRSNIINKSIQNCVKELNKVKYEVEFNSGNHFESLQKIKNILANLSKSCEVILLLTNKTNLEDTNLYRERKRVYHREIAEIAKKAKISSVKNVLNAVDELKRIYADLTILTKYAQDPENSFPDTEIWMLKNSKISAQHRIKTEDIAYSSDLNERGITSGKTQSIIIEGEKGKMHAKLDIFAWFGLADDFVQCLNMLPSGYQHHHDFCPSTVDSRIPTEIIYQEAHYFECRVHIFGAKIMVGFDSTGLADAFIRVIVLGQNRVTQVQRATLSPLWDETLIFSNVIIYGTAEYIQENSIKIAIEVFDKEKIHKSELIGRCFVSPVVKLSNEKYEPPKFPPKLKWEDIHNEVREVGKVLMVTELLELSENLKDLYSFSSARQKTTLSVPKDIRPQFSTFRMEVFFWGIRQIKKKSSIKNKVFVILQCGEYLIKSPILHNVRNQLNFPNNIQYIELELPEEFEYAPPITLKLFHKGPFKKSYVATCIVPSVTNFFYSFSDNTKKKEVYIQVTENEKKPEPKKKTWLHKKNDFIQKKISYAFLKSLQYYKCKFLNKCNALAYESEPVYEEEKLDWWLRYHASNDTSDSHPGVSSFRVYTEELEVQPEFNGFTDFLFTFNMITGHEKKNKSGVIMAKIKAALKLYKWPLVNAGLSLIDKTSAKEGLLIKQPSNEAIKFVVRAYIICGKNLAPRDIYGKSDPYLLVQLGDQSINDRDNYFPKQLNPTFGKCFEFNGKFPQEHLLRIKVIDYDTSSKDDLIGETTIDLENRYYSKHHASCGIAKHFKKEGFGAWKDIYLPTDILKKVCKQSYLDSPVYHKNNVTIGNYVIPTNVNENYIYKEEAQALAVLHKWHEIPGKGFHLVPEHIETRSLYNSKLPGIEQGKLEMWVDIFPADFRHMPPKVDIAPRKPMAMELRAIIWNVDDVVLDDKSLFFREKMSDIYVRGWILSLEEEMQKTDVHYRSLNGEGNFNWRFIFHFNYIPTERKIVVKKKIDAFDLHPEERKHHCKLEIQIWDNDAFGDDYLGTLILELCAMPRGAKLSSRCTLKMLSPNAAKINLFKIRRTRGWWPFRRLKEKQSIGNEYELTGKVDLELEILTEAEAIASPAGKGREEPAGLPEPNRPVTSFNWMINPLKTFRYIIWRKIKKLVIIAAIILVLAFFIITTLYAFPNYMVKKILNA